MSTLLTLADVMRQPVFPLNYRRAAEKESMNLFDLKLKVSGLIPENEILVGKETAKKLQSWYAAQEKNIEAHSGGADVKPDIEHTQPAIAQLVERFISKRVLLHVKEEALLRSFAEWVQQQADVR